MSALSDRQVAILRLLGDGLSDHSVAVRLGMSIHTVKWHNRQIYQQIGVGSRTQAVAWARNNLWGADESRPRSNITPADTSFEGRQDLLNAVGLAIQSSRVTTLVGPPGVGKTRLARELAPSLQGSFTEGVWLVPLAACKTLDQVWIELAEVLEVKPEPGQPLVRQIQRQLHRGRRLLILDNTEQLAELGNAVEQYLLPVPTVRLLVTSRQPLGVYGEQQIPVPPLDSESAIALYLARAKSIDPTFSVEDGNRGAVIALCNRLEGLPLSLELAAARIRLLSPEALLARMDRRLDLLTTGSGSGRSLSLRTTLDTSFALLSSAEAKLFARLSVFAGSISLEALEAVCGGPEVLDHAESLLHKNLLKREPDPNTIRFSMYETIREYAAEQLNGEEAQDLSRRHAQAFAQFAGVWYQTLRTERCLEGQRQFERERRNLTRALEWSATHDPDLLWALTAPMTDYWLVTSRFSEGREWNLRALETLRSGSAVLLSRGLIHAAGLLVYSNAASDLKLGCQLSEQAVSVAAASGNDHLHGWALAVRAAYASLDPAQFSSGLQWADQAGVLAQKAGMEACLTLVFLVRGRIEHLSGRLDAAEAWYEACLTSAKKTGEVRMQVNALGMLSQLSRCLGDQERVAVWLREGLRLVEDYVFDTHLAAMAVSLTAAWLVERGDFGLALLLFASTDTALGTLDLGPLLINDGTQTDLACAQAALPNPRRERLWRGGQELSLTDAVRMINFPWSPLQKGSQANHHTHSM